MANKDNLKFATTAEIQQMWLDFFESKGHTVVASSSLISPDPSTLFTIAGMVPFIPFMLGIQTPPYKRATSVQKCIRTADIAEVGKTARHGTFFQMNGNFSFGDYFKNEVIHFAFDLLTDSRDATKSKSKTPCLELPLEKLWVTIHEEDEEAYEAWVDAGIDPSHIGRCDKTENFWSTGGPGPAGPCSEIFYDRGSEFGLDGGPVIDEAAGGERYLEIWNLVFMQWQIDNVKSKYDFDIVSDLKQKNIDTGMGLERISMLLQDKHNVYEIDQIYPVIESAMKLTGSKYDFSLEEKGDKTAKELNTQFRVLADHIRASLMLIADGVVPSNTGRGYVLRRLIRRCSVAVRKLGYDGNYMENLLTVSYNAMIHAYPEMEKSWKKILEIAVNEETAFNKTLSSGLDILNNSKKNISGENAFKLHDTLGFPIELTLDIADSQGLTVDKTKFEELMKEQKSRAREDTMKKRGRGVDNTVYNDLIPSVASLANKLDAVNNGEIKGFGQSSITEFTGYESLKTESKIIGIIADGISVPAVNEDSAEVEIVLDITSFYAQSGGQLADHGKIVTANGGLIEINDVQKATPFLTVHKGKVISGEFAIGDKVDAVVNYTRRNAIAKAHTSTHIIHQALHEIVGESATQAGSENSPNRVRFDFHSANAVTDAQLKEIEKISNEQILENYKIHENYMSIDAAKNAGAMALFGEKYGDEVRVISFGNDDMYEDTDVSKDWSIELCGGTHIETVGSIGSIALVSEGSIGSGLRRVEALVADSANEFHQTEHALVSQISSLVGAKPADLPERVTSLIAKLKEAETAVAVAAKNALNSSKGSILNAPSLALDNVNVFVTVIDSSVDSSATREFALALLNDASIKYDKNAVVALIVPTVNESNLRFSVTICATDDLVKNANFNAGGVIKEISTVLGGGGGGKPNFATGGSAPISAVSIAEIDSAKSNVQKTVLDTLKSKLAMG